jgi:cytochrome c-type biogenesis protein CcmH
MIWLFIASLTGFVILGLLWPLAHQAEGSRTVDDSDFYRRQVDDIERDRQRGLLDPAAADEAKAEAARRLLAVAKEQEGSVDPALAPRRRNIASLVALIAVPALTLPLYLHLGSPALPDQPFALRAQAPVENADLSTMVAKVEARLAEHPEDGLGWGTIAPVYLSLGRYDEAIKAFGLALRYLGETADLRSGLGEAKMAAADGIVTADALADFERAYAQDPKNERAQYYRALAAEQDGDKPRALSLYQALLERLPPDSEPATLVTTRLAALRGEPIAAPAKDNTDGGQAAMIRSMVERLDTRLSADGSDLEGWLKLLRAYQVLGEPAKAQDALARAKRAQAGHDDALAKLDAMAKELRIAP